MKSDYPFPDKCEKCIHNDVCYMVGECLNYVPDFECDCFEEPRSHGEWKQVGEMTYKCTQCGWLKKTCLMAYCENCGAKMERR